MGKKDKHSKEKARKEDKKHKKSKKADKTVRKQWDSKSEQVADVN